jgi:hypothetical protein
VEITLEFDNRKEIVSLSVLFTTADPFDFIKAILEDLANTQSRMREGSLAPLCFAGEEEMSPEALFHQIKRVTALPARFSPIRISGDPNGLLHEYLDDFRASLAVSFDKWLTP